jgi:hypothetical protein
MSVRAASADAEPGYRRVQSKERSLHAGPLGEAWAALKGTLPLGRDAFGRKLAGALDEAARRGSGFYLGGFPARRALGARLVIDVDPRRIEHRLEHRVAEAGRIYLIRDRFLGAGDWSPLLTRVRSASTYREVEEIVKAGLDYRETRAYREALEKANGANPVNRNFVALNSTERVETYFRQTAELCRSIRERGVERRAAVGRRFGGNPKALSVRLPWVEWGEADIGAAVGADGTIYRFASGKHRTAAAQSLGLSSMPVEVRMVHADWLGARMREGANSPVEALVEGVRALDLRRR